MKTKIVDEIFDEFTGSTTVTIQNKYGHFTGVAYCSKEDSFSQFQGERIAATRANINFLKHRISQEKNKLHAIDNFIKTYYLSTDTDFHYFNHPLYKHALKEIKRYEKNIEDYKSSIQILKNSIKKMDEERQKVLLRANKNK